MSENDPQLPEKIRQALKESPQLTPPESFYQGVLQKIERPAAPWYWGLPIKTFATVCTLSLIVLMTHDARKSKPALFQSTVQTNEKSASLDKSEQAKNKGKEAPPAEKAVSPENLVGTKEVQNHLNRDISGYVGDPSPFEDVDEEARKDLLADAKIRRAAPAQAASSTNAALPVLKQARDTVNGEATQGSFMQQQALFAKKSALQSPPKTAAPPLSSGSGAMLSSRMRQEDKPALAELGFREKGDVQEWKGATSGIATFRTAVVRTPEQWRSLWRDHTHYILPPPPAPDIDFETLMVVGVFDGTKPTAGYRVDITDVQILPGKVLVTYRETSPPAGMMTAQIITQPYTIQVIPRSVLPVTFQKAP